jgi:hypothetical protein
MKKGNTKSFISDPDKMKAEYDFSNMKSGVRGKHYKTYRSGHSISILKENGSTDIQFFGLKDGAVMLDPDILKYFPNSEAVNKALRALITIMPEKQKKENSRQTSR